VFYLEPGIGTTIKNAFSLIHGAKSGMRVTVKCTAIIVQQVIAVLDL
jgi:hypothetical protein